ncbi:MAG: hypothetical protein LWX56_04550 [Ignavibacteria bacterium]|nr:hypothetical protein [Ignavibacteria bacterium]
MRAVLLLIMAVLFVPVFIYAQNGKKEHEAETSVPALAEFHDVIYPIWHTYYPEKDFAGLRTMTNAVKAGAEKIYQVTLPGFYREKQKGWEHGIELFKVKTDAFLKASAETDNEKLLQAAEALHSSYEMLVRVLHPVPRNVEAFHKVLYVVYHDYLPNKNYEKIAEVSSELKNRADSITTVRLRKNLEAKKEEFQNAAKELVDACAALQASAAGKDSAVMEKLVLVVHTKYQALEKIFD